MENAQKGFEFLDLSNVDEDEVKEIQELLNPANGITVELPWKFIPDEDPPEQTCNKIDEDNFSRNVESSIENNVENNVENDAEKNVENRVENNIESSVQDNIERNETEQETELVPEATEQEQVVYTSTPYPFVANVSHPGLMTINPAAFVTPPGVNVTSVNHFANPQPYFLPRTAIPYLRAYAQVGVPLITLPQQDTHDVTLIQQSPYHTLPPVPSAVVKAESDINDGRQKLRNHSDKQYIRRGRKKILTNNSYTTEVSGAVDPYHQGTMIAETAAISGDTSGEHLPQSMTHTPIVPFSAFAMTGGALHIAAPTPGYHPGITPLPYSHLSNPQAPSTPVFYVPVYNPTYGYIHQSTSGSPVLTTVPTGMPYTTNGCNTVTGESLNSCSETQSGAVQTVNQKCVSIRELEDSVNNHKKKLSVSEMNKPDISNLPGKDNIKNVYSERTTGGYDNNPTDCITNDISRLNLTDSNERDVSTQENGSASSTLDSSHRSWADLFRNEDLTDGINGMDHPSEISAGETISYNDSKLTKIKNSSSLPLNDNRLTNSERVND